MLALWQIFLLVFSWVDPEQMSRAKQRIDNLSFSFLARIWPRSSSYDQFLKTTDFFVLLQLINFGEGLNNEIEMLIEVQSCFSIEGNQMTVLWIPFKYKANDLYLSGTPPSSPLNNIKRSTIYGGLRAAVNVAKLM
ncbi:hypothetical protein M9H77_12280 [Catharanthus roseus]|uniref:Uncharacterized protein n=1 Tax=Catharanthus roseus TaxID=4058 RepID=A0ACC0BGZ1_CATRO|nr:hypothetical protein M9H77_12280 [Catharanthus roseus]